MLLQGFACEPSQSSLAPFAPLARMPSSSAVAAALALASPPASPPQMAAHDALNNLFDSCRSLQALLAAPPAPAALPITPPQQHHELLATPPLAHAPSPMKLRLRSTRRAGSSGCNEFSAATYASANTSTNTVNTLTSSGSAAGAGTVRKRIVKRTQTPRGLNKRRRAADDDMGREDAVDAEVDDAEASDYGEAEDPLSLSSNSEPFTLSLLAPSPLRRYPSTSSPFTTTRARAATIAAPCLPAFGSAEPHAPNNTASNATPSTPPRPQTPKRARIAPEALPLGLERSDFHALHADGVPDDSTRAGTLVEVEADGEAWTTEDDRMLVELVLEKLKLSKEEWQDCARSLGKDRHSLGRRWKSLMLHGDIGLKPSSRTRRSKIHGTWR